MSNKFTRCLIIVFFPLVTVTATYAQQFYVIVGAFAQEGNAQKFTGYVRSLRFPANYELNTAKNYFYVYVLKTNSRESALAQVKDLKEESEFKDAWLFSGQLGNAEEPAIVAVEPKQPETIEAPEPPAISEQLADTTTLAEQDPMVANAVEAEGEIKVKGKLFKFALQTVDGKPIHGAVHNVDYRRGREIAAYPSDQYIDVPHPSKENNPMSMVCGIFGYKEVVKFLDYNNPALDEGVTKDGKGAWVVSYQLERLKKGDVSVMYQVSFYKDTVVILPQSKTEMDELVNMMRDNPNYKIKIHGHCNGNNARRIIALGTTKNYFNIRGSDERNGTAKELSKLRAEAVQTYLADNGIESNRSEIYAWGALNMLVPQTSNSAKLNDRIEIEILDD
jgi:outer membrane protein OmpA-like peptidoglycan-associated protein